VSRVSSIALGDIMATKSGSVDPSKFTEEIFDLYSIPAFWEIPRLRLWAQRLNRPRLVNAGGRNGLREQHRFCCLMKPNLNLLVEALKTAQRASLAELDALFATLQHCAFKGEL